MKSVEKNYEMERHYTKDLMNKRKTKAEQILKLNQAKIKALENKGMKDYRKRVRELRNPP